MKKQDLTEFDDVISWQIHAILSDFRKISDREILVGEFLNQDLLIRIEALTLS